MPKGDDQALPVPSELDRAIRQISNCRNLLRDFDVTKLLSNNKGMLASAVLENPNFVAENIETYHSLKQVIELLELAQQFADGIDASQVRATLIKQDLRRERAKRETQETQTQGPAGQGGEGDETDPIKPGEPPQA